MRANPTNDVVIMAKRLVGMCAGPLITALTGCRDKGRKSLRLSPSQTTSHDSHVTCPRQVYSCLSKGCWPLEIWPACDGH